TPRSTPLPPAREQQQERRPTHRRGRRTENRSRRGLSGLMAEEKKPHPQPPPSWSALRLDLAGLVLSLLPVYADCACFAAVCPQWRAAARQLQLPPLPLLALPDGTFYSLMATVTLPALSSVRLRPPNASAKSKWAEGGSVESANLYITWMRINEADNLRISKLILCSPNLVAALVGIGPISQILMCQPGALSWSVRAYDRIEDFQDMSFYQGKLYAIAKDENLLVVNISQDHSTGDPQVSRIGRVIEGDCPTWYDAVFEDNSSACKKLYLVESRGMLLMVRRTIWCQFPEPGGDGKIMGGQNEFEVFEADFEHSRWVKVSTVGDDQVLFLGRRCSRSMSVSQYGLPGDRIFFLDDDEDNRLDYAYDEEKTSFGVYSMRFRSIGSGDPNISWKRCAEMYLAAWLFPQDR
uniref:KIB1-4 beta-propeller domain-containing protein n=1 Tax=Aegilops tauschii subsp. strangulata TaxID=200361 RepID=A0A452ZX11_AEGTS